MRTRLEPCERRARGDAEECRRYRRSISAGAQTDVARRRAQAATATWDAGGVGA